jgi:5-formaminoimidazole-4-carboxamide-1-beta-D-ribofuranosyl 5'-monophosphate synthetase
VFGFFQDISRETFSADAEELVLNNNNNNNNNKDVEIQEFMYRDKTNVEPEMYDYTNK